MKKLFTITLITFLALLLNESLFAGTVQISSGTVSRTEVPISPWASYSYTQQIYLQSEINAKGNITKIRFRKYSGDSGANSDSWTVYLGHTSKSSFSSTSDWIATGSMTQVFNGTVSFPASGNWLEVTLATPFAYNNTSNLVVAIDENKANSETINFYASSVPGTNRALFSYSNSTNISPASPPSGTLFEFYAHMQLDISATTQAKDLVFSDIGGNRMTVGWTNGNGSKRVVFAKQASSGTTSPVNNTTYTANSSFGSGTEIATGWYCVYNGTGSSVTVTGLTASTDYIFQVFEYNEFGSDKEYLTSTATNNPKVQMTASVPTTQASNILFSNVFKTQMDISWTNGDGSKRVVFAKAASSGTTTPVDVTTYTANATFGSGTQIGSTGWYCVYNGSGASVSVTGLSANTDYIFQVFEYNGSSGGELYLTTTATNNPKVQATNTTPAPNYALDFDGTNDYVSVPANASLNMYNSSFTIETWVKSSSNHSSAWKILLEYGNWQAGGYHLSSYNQNEIKVDFYGRSSVGATATFDWTDGKWHHIAGVFDNTNNKLIVYIDGVKKQEVEENNAPGDAALNLGIGARGNGSYFVNAEMDEIRIWNVARSQADIQANMCKKLAGNESGLVAYYQITDGSGTTLSDNSSNSNNGTLTNMDDTDWVTSGAAIGDASISDYDSPSSVNLASTHGDDVTVGTISGSPDGIQIYRVDGEPNVTTPPGDMTQLYPDHYFGVFMAGGTLPTYTLTYDYTGHPSVSNENALELAYRANNATTSWTQGNATLNTTANTLILAGQTGTEYILGTETISAPTTQATNIVFSQVYATQMDISWTNGDGNNRVVFAKAASSGTTTPVDETTYTANASFGSGTQIGSTGWYCVYNSDSSSVTVTGLSANTDYIFQVFEYNRSSGNELYLTETATDNPKVQATSNADVPTPNYALSFDGTNDYVSTNYASPIQTLEFWIKRDAYSTSSGICSQRWNATEEASDWQMHWGDVGAANGYKIRIYSYNSSVSGREQVTTASFNIGKWYHVAVTSQANSLKFYVDGVFDSEHTNLNVVLGGSTDEKFIFGGAGANAVLWPHNGKMDEVRVWNVVRTQTQIQENMCKKLAGNESGLVAYYQMTNGSGTSLTDNSSNSNNGTLQNMDDADWVTSGAAIGDASIADYSSPSSVNLASSYGDDVTVGTISGSPGGVQIYRVDGAPNITTAPGNITQLTMEHYFGVFIAGGSTPTYTLTYNYDGHPGISNESSLDLAYRANNATASWTEGNATLDQNANTLTLTGQTGTEYILGSESSNPLPVELTSFSAITDKGKVILNWQTATEVNNYGFEIQRAIVNVGQTISLSTWEKIGFVAGHGNSNSTKEYSFVDEPALAGKYSYRLKQIDTDGTFSYSEEVEVEIANIPAEFTLYQNYPNPFNPSTTIKFGLPKDGMVTLEVYNIIGEKVAELINQELKAGYHNYQFSINNYQLSSGIYLYRLTTGEFISSKKMILLK